MEEQMVGEEGKSEGGDGERKRRGEMGADIRR